MKKMIWALLLLTVTIFANELDKAEQALNEQDYQTALKILKPLAKKRNIEAKAMLGYMYLYGLGVNIDMSKAEKYYKPCATKKYPKCNLFLGSIYMDASQTVVNPLNYMQKNLYKNMGPKGGTDTKAKYFYEQAIKNFKIAASNIPAANALLGKLYAFGVSFPIMDIVPPDYKKAKHYLNIAIASKDPRAMEEAGNILGLMYQNGTGVLQDFSEAKKYFNLAIKNGNTLAKCNLGSLYLQQNKISKAKQILKEGYNDGNEYCGQIWNQNNLGQ